MNEQEENIYSKWYAKNQEAVEWEKAVVRVCPLNKAVSRTDIFEVLPKIK